VSLRDRILASDDVTREPVHVPWDTGDEKIYVRELTMRDLDRWFKGGEEITVNMALMAEVVAATLVDEHGARILEDADAEAMLDKSAQTIRDLFTEVMRISGLGEEGEAEAARDFPQGKDGPSSTA